MTQPQFKYNVQLYPKEWFEGLAHRMRGDDEAARKAFAAARPAVDKQVQADAYTARKLSFLAVIDAGMGRGEDAAREGRQAVEMTRMAPKTSDASTSGVCCDLAVVYAWTGQSDEAVTLLEERADKPAAPGLLFQVTYGDLRLDPIWDPLRGNPRFTALLEHMAPKPPR